MNYENRLQEIELRFLNRFNELEQELIEKERILEIEYDKLITGGCNEISYMENCGQNR